MLPLNFLRVVKYRRLLQAGRNVDRMKGTANTYKMFGGEMSWNTEEEVVE
jgi:hypothetical protein